MSWTLLAGIVPCRRLTGPWVSQWSTIARAAVSRDMTARTVSAGTSTSNWLTGSCTVVHAVLSAAISTSGVSLRKSPAEVTGLKYAVSST